MAGFLRFLLRRGGRLVFPRLAFHPTVPLPCNQLAKTLLSAIALVPKDVDDKQFEDNDEWSKERDIIRNISLAIEAITSENFTLAERHLNEALGVSNDTSTVGVTCVYDMLATLAYKRGDIKKSVVILNELIHKLPQWDDNHIHFTIKLAQLYEQLSNHELSEKHFKKCICMQKKKMCSKEPQDRDIFLLTSALFWYGKFLSSRGRHREAKTTFEEAYSSCTLTKSVNLQQVMVIMYNMGDAALAVGEKETALNHFLNSIVIGKSIDHQDLPLYYNKVGHILMLKGKLCEAKTWFSTAKAFAQKYRDKALVIESETFLQTIEQLDGCK